MTVQYELAIVCDHCKEVGRVTHPRTLYYYLYHQPDHDEYSRWLRQSMDEARSKGWWMSGVNVCPLCLKGVDSDRLGVECLVATTKQMTLPGLRALLPRSRLRSSKPRTVN